ncbi:MAG TPA: hypothetical protein VMJ93_00630 [Verrucomicrobiae bacterium]|nr:hypothetical protein [Verrucomicrobiae bacterium]
MKFTVRLAILGLACSLAGIVSSCSHPQGSASNYSESSGAYSDSQSGSPSSATLPQPASPANGWNEASAAAYLDQRAAWWVQWRGAARDHGTFCISCHTTVPYILAQPVLRANLNQPGLSPNETSILDNVSKRVRLWKDVAPYYSDTRFYTNHAAGSRATEAVLNALVLSARDAQAGHLGGDTRTAFENLWALQLTSGGDKGAWMWQEFNLLPWEEKGSEYYGAALAAIAVGIAPDNYRSTPSIQGNVQLLRGYLLRDYASQSLLNQTFLLLASAKLPGLLTPAQQKSIVDQLSHKQQSDGGWSLSSLVGHWRGLTPSTLYALVDRREDGTPQVEHSDGDATAMITYAMQQVGIPRDNPHLQRGLDWLLSHQNPIDGSWTAYSLNRQRDLTSNIGRFMSDEATGYAVLSLTQAGIKPAAAAVSQARATPPAP